VDRVVAWVSDRADGRLVSGDLVDEAVVNCLGRVEGESGAEVGCDFGRGPPGGKSDPLVQPVESLGVVIQQCSELARSPGDLEFRIAQAEPRMREGGSLRAGRQHSGRDAFDPTGTQDVHRDSEQVDHVDQGPRRLEGCTMAIQLELDGGVA
jgi:hypothetical protein